MPLVELLSDALTIEAVAQFSYGHAVDHAEIDQALQAQFRQQTPGFPMDPMPLDKVGGYSWLLLHQQRHSTMNTILGLTGSDLSKFDLSNREDLVAFITINFSEHQQARARLGI